VVDRARGRLVGGIVLIWLAGCGASHTPSTFDTKSTLTPCSQLVPGCDAKRLPDITLTGQATDGAMKSADGFDTGGIMSFDEALHRDSELEHHSDAKTVRVELGSSDAWGPEAKLYYAIDWGGVCFDTTVTSGGTPDTCVPGTFSTVIDAHTGKFIVSGN